MTSLRNDIEPDALVDLLRELVRIPSVNPDLVPSSSGEAAIGDFVAERLRRIGMDVARQAVATGRSNVVGRLDVPGATKTILFDSHMDTQALESMGDRAISAEIVGGRLYGRGACDDKAPLATMIYAMGLIVACRAELKSNVVFTATVGEEHGMPGIQAAIAAGLKADAAVVGEPTDLRVVVAHKGFLRLRLTTHGRSAHTSNPDVGDNAIYQMAELTRFVRDVLTTRWRHVTHPLLTGPTIAVCEVSGGTAINVVPDSCWISLDRRVLPNEDLDALLADFDAALDEFRRDHPGVTVTREEPFSTDGGVDTPADAPIAMVAGDACRAAGRNGDVVGVNYGTHASKLSRLGGIQSIVLGPGSILQAHTDDEYVEIDQLAPAAEIYARIALEF